MNKEMLERIRINQAGRIRDKAQAARHAIVSGSGVGGAPWSNKDTETPFQITDDFSARLQGTFEAVKRYELETKPRETVLKMFMERKLDENFIFKVTKGEGENYVQAMRQILSRTRKKALRNKMPLNEFKLLTVNITEKEDHDVVTLVRTKRMSEHMQSVYDDLITAMAKKMPQTS